MAGSYDHMDWVKRTSAFFDACATAVPANTMGSNRPPIISEWKRSPPKETVKPDYYQPEDVYKQDNSRSGISGRQTGNTSANTASVSSTNKADDPAANDKLMIWGLAPHISEKDIRREILQYNLMAMEVKVIRQKKTGASRGFAFVKFKTVAEAKCWMDKTQGLLLFPDQTKASMKYTLKDKLKSDEQVVADAAASFWKCLKCGTQNSQQKDTCFMCATMRPPEPIITDPEDEISLIPTK